MQNKVIQQYAVKDQLKLLAPTSYGTKVNLLRKITSIACNIPTHLAGLREVIMREVMLSRVGAEKHVGIKSCGSDGELFLTLPYPFPPRHHILNNKRCAAIASSVG